LGVLRITDEQAIMDETISKEQPSEIQTHNVKSRRSGLSVYTKFKKALSTDFNNSSMGCVSWFIIHNADVEHLGL